MPAVTDTMHVHIIIGNTYMYVRILLTAAWSRPQGLVR